MGKIIPVPKGVPAQLPAAVTLKGMTARYLIRRTYAVKAGETVLFHAAAGGVWLAEAARAHRGQEARRTDGSIVLVP